MKCDDQLFIGLIPLPGALISYLRMTEAGPKVLGDTSRLDDGKAGAAFLFASYLFGHPIFLLGSWLDEFYDWGRCYTLNTQMALLASRGHLLRPTGIDPRGDLGLRPDGRTT